MLKLDIHEMQEKEKRKETVSKLVKPIYDFVGDNIEEIFKSRDYILGRYENVGLLKRNTYINNENKEIELEPSVNLCTSNVFEAIELEKHAKIIKNSVLPRIYLLNETRYYVKRGYGTYLSESINLCEELNISSKYIKL